MQKVAVVFAQFRFRKTKTGQILLKYLATRIQIQIQIQTQMKIQTQTQ